MSISVYLVALAKINIVSVKEVRWDRVIKKVHLSAREAEQYKKLCVLVMLDIKIAFNSPL